ncbi:hypothetical protein BU26DRAFT_521288 [Trematosphaeria pertusa]|uniref:Uncharacterized protein n=1 Tax=Trematosphaeria pertusa TaxID=390896 RepID=A0A6A6I9J3_9PLEO|nr:uncharacterized protein BU26DRAFT_521288 [Trematosphaeria pertusa]KAF2246889.1 hypothetical protein BU26DRAFT_521288 [Trematosphaeria pertusa]
MAVVVNNAYCLGTSCPRCYAFGDRVGKLEWECRSCGLTYSHGCSENEIQDVAADSQQTTRPLPAIPCRSEANRAYTKYSTGEVRDPFPPAGGYYSDDEEDEEDEDLQPFKTLHIRVHSPPLIAIIATIYKGVNSTLSDFKRLLPAKRTMAPEANPRSFGFSTFVRHLGVISQIFHELWRDHREVSRYSIPMRPRENLSANQKSTMSIQRTKHEAYYQRCVLIILLRMAKMVGPRHRKTQKSRFVACIRAIRDTRKTTIRP